MKKNAEKVQKEVLVYTAVLFLMLLVLFLLILNSKNASLRSANLPVFSLENFLPADVSVEGSNILLSADCYMIVMTTTPEQADSIARILQNVSSFRPNAHDLFALNIKYFNIPLLFVKVHSLIEGTYYSTIILGKENNFLAVDARPSDAIAIALRVNAPVYITKELLDYAEKIC